VLGHCDIIVASPQNKGISLLHLVGKHSATSENDLSTTADATVTHLYGLLADPGLRWESRILRVDYAPSGIYRTKPLPVFFSPHFLLAVFHDSKKNPARQELFLTFFFLKCSTSVWGR
jgi:hypothetical protein